MILTPPYRGLIEGHELIESVPLKLYFASIYGRDEPNAEWTNSNIDREKFIISLEKMILGFGRVGIPHIVIALPHVGRVYRWGDPKEEYQTNVVELGKFNTLKIDDGIVPRQPEEPMACPIELLILAKEAEFRSSSQNKHRYIYTFVQSGEEILVENPNFD